LPILIVLAVLLPALISPAFGFTRPGYTYPLAILGAAGAAALSLAGLWRVLSSGSISYHLGGWPPPEGIELVLDPLAGFMAVVVSSIGLIAIIYSRRSLLAEIPGKFSAFYGTSLLLLTGLLGIVLTGDLFNLYVFLEIASLSAYALIAIGSKQAPFSAFRYVIMGTLGGTFYLLGVGFLYFSTGTLNMADMANLLPALVGSHAVLAAAVFMVVGLGLKMALFPMHMWLPDAYTYAASSVTGLIAPIMTKVGAYAMIRILLTVFPLSYVLNDVPILTAVAWLSAAGIIWGSVMAIAQKDLRRMLAYSSVSQVAYVGLGLALANPLALIGGLLQIASHAMTKATLFFIAGAIRFRTGTVGISTLAGTARRMPWTSAALVVAALSMVGIPPTSGFFAKWYLVLGSIQTDNWAFVAVIVISSLLNAVYFFRILEQAYLAPETKGAQAVSSTSGTQHSDSPRSQEIPPSMLWPILFLAALILIVGIFNALVVTEVLRPALPVGL